MMIHLNKNNIHIVFYFYCNMWDRVPTFKKTQDSQSTSGKYDPTKINVVFHFAEVLCEK
jgi:hypothetical protein